MESPQVDLKQVKHSIPIDILGDLLSRFVINVPDTAKQNLIRICFQIELAYWYYLDFYVHNDPKLQGCSFREFAAHSFKHTPSLEVHYPRLSEILDEFREYKQSVPTYGAIILNEDNSQVLLVQSYWAKTSWGFPKGKVNEDEDPTHCAVREVYEETGFDISPYLDACHFLEAVINEQLVRLYVIQGVPIDTEFQPRTRFEIKACEWFSVGSLPSSKKDITPKLKMGLSANSFYMVLPFVKRIKQISHQSSKAKRQRHKSTSLSEGESSSTPVANRTSQQANQISGSQKKRERKSQSKRQLFSNDEPEEFVFSAPSWLNFKANRAAIMECIH